MQFSKKWHDDELCDEEIYGSSINNVFNGNVNDKPLRTIKEAILNPKTTSNDNSCDNNEKGSLLTTTYLHLLNNTN